MRFWNSTALDLFWLPENIDSSTFHILHFLVDSVALDASFRSCEGQTTNVALEIFDGSFSALAVYFELPLACKYVVERYANDACGLTVMK